MFQNVVDENKKEDRPKIIAKTTTQRQHCRSTAVQQRCSDRRERNGRNHCACRSCRSWSSDRVLPGAGVVPPYCIRHTTSSTEVYSCTLIGGDMFQSLAKVSDYSLEKITYQQASSSLCSEACARGGIVL
ncbi:hypothetical protein J6590_034541 [Homalodisca vitripennis]|nr:hypothetical protein J6590_034541 [Homalodisca vitripennis]